MHPAISETFATSCFPEKRKRTKHRHIVSMFGPIMEKYHHFDRIRPVLPGVFLFRQVVNQLADRTSFPFVLCTFGILSVNKELCFTAFLRKALK